MEKILRDLAPGPNHRLPSLRNDAVTLTIPRGRRPGIDLAFHVLASWLSLARNAPVAGEDQISKSRVAVAVVTACLFEPACR